MGKSVPGSLERLRRLVLSNSKSKRKKALTAYGPVSIDAVLGESRKNMEMGNSNSSPRVEQRRLPLSSVVSDCVKRWFHDALNEAHSGDSAMQVLVAQMYNSGYGVSKNPHKGKAWIERASESRASALKVGDKRPGYVVSDSDSEDGNGNDN